MPDPNQNGDSPQFQKPSGLEDQTDDFFASFGSDFAESLAADSARFTPTVTAHPVEHGYVKYKFPLPWLAPQDWRVLSSNDSPAWTAPEIEQLGNATFLIHQLLRFEPDPALSSVLESIPISRADTDELLIECGGTAVACWNCQNGQIKVSPEIVRDFFQLTATLLHEYDHAIHEKQLPGSIKEECVVEIRAHQNTVYRLESLARYLNTIECTGPEAQACWNQQAELILAVQAVGLGSYRICNEFLFGVDSILGKHADSPNPAQAQVVKILQRNVALFKYLRESGIPDEASVELLEHFYRDLNQDTALIKTVPALALSLPIWRDEVDRFARAVAAYRAVDGTA